MVAAAGSIRQVRPLRDDPFESEPAGMLQHGRSVDFEMLAEPNGRASRKAGSKPLQQVFAVFENHFH